MMWFVDSAKTPDKSDATHSHAGEREFDTFAPAYEDLLKDPLRDYFSSRQTEFFHERKRDLITRRFARLGVDTKAWSYLDVGCGQGELLRLLAPGFAVSTGCDTSAGMLQKASSGNIVFQDDARRLPFEDCSFDFVTAVCVYHHVPLADRAAVTREVYRVLKPGGVFCIIEHNPLNPITRLIVARTPVDADAKLLSYRQTCRLMRACSVDLEKVSFFMYFPELLYRMAGRVEEFLEWLPLGGQYAVFGRRPPLCPDKQGR
jgi:SAM-dependent methyltransferase